MSKQHEQMATDATAVLARRLDEATTIEVLSTRYDKVLSVMQEPDGRKFVSREYEIGAEREFEQELGSPGLPFAEGLAAMQDMYKRVGIAVVNSSVLPASVSKKTRVLSEYLPDAVEVRRASIDARKTAVSGLAKLLNPANPYLPSLAVITTDLFMFTTDAAGNQKPVIVDVDPRLQVKRSRFDSFGRMADSTRGAFMDHVGLHAEHFWSTNDTETSELARAFLEGLASIKDESVFNGTATLESLMNMHMLTQPKITRLPG